MIESIKITNPKKSTKVKCPNCKSVIRADYFKDEAEEWICVDCYTCGYGRVVKQEEINMIQPSSPLFEMIYGNPFKETEKRKKEMAWEKEKRKEYLDYKYNKEFKNPSDRKFVKDWVLGE